MDTHHVVRDKDRARGFLLSLFVIPLLANALYLFLDKDSSAVNLFWSFLSSGYLVMLLSKKSVKKESVTIIPAFGIQLETHYSSGRAVYRFIPIDNILEPVLLEHVTPITCYWTLSLVLRGEEELMLVFKELRPPVKMLVPIWKALRAATDADRTVVVVEEDG